MQNYSKKTRSVKKLVSKPTLKPVLTENVLIIVTTHQSDDILRLITKLKNHGHIVKLVSTDKFQKNNSDTIERTQKEINDELTNIFRKAELEPTIIVTDNEILQKELLNIKKSCSIYLLHAAFHAIYFHRDKLLRKIKSETHFAKINVNYNEYPRKKENVYEFLRDIPKCCIFFTSFGYYRRQYNFKVILKSFYRFLNRQDKIFGNTVMLAIGGNFNEAKDEQYFVNFYGKVTDGKFAANVVLLRNISTEEKKAFLRLSYAMIYFNESVNPNSDIRLAMSVGTPLIGIDNGFVKTVIKRKPLTGYLVPMHLNTIVDCMYSLTSPTTYQKVSMHSRLNYLKYYTKFSRELEAIKVQDKKQKYGKSNK